MGSSSSARRHRWLVAVAICCAAGLAASACSGGNGTSASGGKPAAPAGLQVSITPANGSSGATPSNGITVTAAKGRLTNVTVTTGGDQVTGSMNAAGTVWHSTWALDVSQSYTVTAKAEGTEAAGTSGKTITRTSSFKTLTPSQTFATQVYEAADQTYGVGMPIILYFNHQITDKAAVERALQITTS